MNRYILPLLVLLLAACGKDDPGTYTSTKTSTCNCMTVFFDRYKFVNWDGVPDTADFLTYSSDDSFKKARGGYYGNPVGADGYIEGVMVRVDSAWHYKIRFRKHPQTYYITKYEPGADQADCALLNDSTGCYNSYRLTVNDSVITVPRRINMDHGLQTDTMFLY